MPVTRRKPRTATNRAPAWLDHYQRTGEEPPEGTPEWQECSNWRFLNGYAAHKGWPPPRDW
jgi:hypothetical protein